MAKKEDITEQKKADDELKIQAQILENMHEGVNVSDEKGTILFTNKAFDTMFGYNQGELIGKKVSILNNLSKEDNARFVSEVIKQLKAKGSWSGEVNNIRKDRTQFISYSNISALEISGKKYWISVQGDITEQKETEETLRRSEQKFKSLVETTPDWVWEVDAKGVYTYASPKVKDMLGYTPSEVLGKTPFDFMPKEEAKKIGKIFGEIASKKKPFYALENTNLHKKGHEVVLETSGVPLFDDSGGLKGYRGIDRDITERKRAEEELTKTREKMRKKIDDLERFNKVAVGRELRMVQLKKQIKELERQLARK